jgi:hypothetical protein
MENEFEVVVTIELKEGRFKTVSSGNPIRKPLIRDIANFTDNLIEETIKHYPGSRVISINYLPQMFHRG